MIAYNLRLVDIVLIRLKVLLQQELTNRYLSLDKLSKQNSLDIHEFSNVCNTKFTNDVNSTCYLIFIQYLEKSYCYTNQGMKND